MKRGTLFLTSEEYWQNVVDYENRLLCYSKTMSKYKESIIRNVLKNEGPVVQVSIPKGRAITGHIYKNYVRNKVKKHNERNLHHST